MEGSPAVRWQAGKPAPKGVPPQSLPSQAPERESSAVYQVYRFVNGYKQNNTASFATFREAYGHAQRAQARERNPSVEYRIFGLMPEGAPGSKTSPHRTWFVLDHAPQPLGTVRASRFLHKRGERQPASPKSASPKSASAKTSGARTFRVDREALGVRRTLRDGFATQADAHTFIAAQKAKERDPNALYIIVAPSDKRTRSRTPVGVRSRYLRGAPRLTGYVAGSKTQRARHDWEVENRKGDA